MWVCDIKTVASQPLDIFSKMIVLLCISGIILVCLIDHI